MHALVHGYGVCAHVRVCVQVCGHGGVRVYAQGLCSVDTKVCVHVCVHMSVCVHATDSLPRVL